MEYEILWSLWWILAIQHQVYSQTQPQSQPQPQPVGGLPMQRNPYMRASWTAKQQQQQQQQQQQRQQAMQQRQRPATVSEQKDLFSGLF